MINEYQMFELEIIGKIDQFLDKHNCKNEEEHNKDCEQLSRFDSIENIVIILVCRLLSIMDSKYHREWLSDIIEKAKSIYDCHDNTNNSKNMH